MIGSFRFLSPLGRLLLFGILTAMVFGSGIVPFSENDIHIAGTERSLASHSPSRASLVPSTPPPSRAAFDTLHAVSEHVFRYTNETRREHGLSVLKKDTTLAAVACAHNGDMFRRDFFKHVNPDGEHPRDRVAKMHRRLVGGTSENLYGQTRIRKGPDALAALMVEKWVNSPPHRKNLLDPHATHLGVCVLRRQNTIRATQVFAKVVAYLSAPLPKRMKPGEEVPISFEQTFPPKASIAQYDFWNPRTEQRVSAPTVFIDSIRVPDTTGTLRPRFYVLEEGRYVIHQGPEVTIAPPQ